MKTRLMMLTAVALGIGTLVLSNHADAQETPAQPSTGEDTSCVQPRDDTDGGSGAIDLEACDGVIAPAPNTDPSIVIRKPDPDMNELPIIPPEAVPQTEPDEPEQDE